MILITKRNPLSVNSGTLMVTITICADNKFLCYHHSITYCVGWRNIALALDEYLFEQDMHNGLFGFHENRT